MSKPSQRPRKLQLGKVGGVNVEDGLIGMSIYRTLLSSRWRFVSAPPQTGKGRHSVSGAPSPNGQAASPEGASSPSKGSDSPPESGLKGREGHTSLQKRSSTPRLTTTEPDPRTLKRASAPVTRGAAAPSATPSKAATAASHPNNHAPKSIASKAVASNVVAGKSTASTKTVSRSKSKGDLASGHQIPLPASPKAAPVGPRPVFLRSSPSKKGLKDVGKPARASVPDHVRRAKHGAPKPKAVPPKADAVAPKPNSVTLKPDTSPPSSGAVPVSKEPASKPLPLIPDPTPPKSDTPTQTNSTPKKGNGATSVRFGATTVHRVEIAPGQHLHPIRRGHKSKSGLSYLNPPADKAHLKVTVEFPPGKETKMKRHQLRQAAMERYWLRTEEEEAEWRAEATRIAEEETEKYRSEPSSSPPPPEQESDEEGREKGGQQEEEESAEEARDGGQESEQSTPSGAGHDKPRGVEQGENAESGNDQREWDKMRGGQGEDKPVGRGQVDGAQGSEESTQVATGEEKQGEEVEGQQGQKCEGLSDSSPETRAVGSPES